MKTCRLCNDKKELTEFYTRKVSPDGYRNECKKCQIKRNKHYVMADPSRWKQYHKNRGPIYYAQNKDQYRNGDLKRLFGITLDQYKEMFEKQKGLCAICGNPENRITRSKQIQTLSVDHDHQTGKVRGLLCNRCNRGIGYLKDNTEILQNAINYLKEK